MKISVDLDELSIDEQSVSRIIIEELTAEIRKIVRTLIKEESRDLRKIVVRATEMSLASIKEKQVAEIVHKMMGEQSK